VAESPAHKFGQIIGNVLEDAVEPLLREFAVGHGLYLDRQGPRAARRGKRVCWTDESGNTHNLDYVLERGGSDETIGVPVGFIESAWRRYTKHSRNKAQEIQGAILPIVRTYQTHAPFIGVVLAGVFTEGSLQQLRSLGFAVLYFPYETVVEAFNSVNIDAYFDEKTAVADFKEKVQACESLPPQQYMLVSKRLTEINSENVQAFMQSLEQAVTRRITRIRVFPLHGSAFEWASLDEAIAFIEGYDETATSSSLLKYEIQVQYSNGDHIEGQFNDKDSALDFLHLIGRSEHVSRMGDMP